MLKMDLNETTELRMIKTKYKESSLTLFINDVTNIEGWESDKILRIAREEDVNHQTLNGKWGRMIRNFEGHNIIFLLIEFYLDT